MTYILTALELLGRNDLLDALDVQWVGMRGPQGAVNTGDKALNHTRNLLTANPDLTNRRVLLLYDSDTNKPSEDAGPVSVRSLPKNETNTKARKGIEDLLPVDIFEDRFYPARTTVTDYGERQTIEALDKMASCRWVCDERKQANDFDDFSALVLALEKFLVSMGRAKGF